jgi:hypothetical protein
MADRNKTAALSADTKKQLAANKRRGTALLALIARRKDRITEDFYDIGEALRELLDSKLYAAMGYASFEAMLEARKLMSSTQAFKLVRLVESIPRDEALRLGQEKAYALVTYTAATPEEDVPAALVRKNAKIDGKPLLELSKRELQDAAKAAKEAKPSTPAARERQKLERTLEKKARALLKKAGVTKTTVQVKKEVVVVTIPRAWLEKVVVE